MEVGQVQIGERTLAYVVDGDHNGFPVIYHHGTPSSGMLYQPWVADARKRGIRLIGYDRPGYGTSTRHAGRSVADVANDMAALLDHLGIETFATWGMSGGGPHALACAGLLHGRCVAVAALGSVAPFDADDLDFLAGMGEDNVLEFGAALKGEDALRPMLEQWRPVMLEGTPEGLIEVMSTVLSEADVAVLSGDAAGFLVDSNNRGLRESIDGWLDDDLAFAKPWGFALEDIRIPTLMWQGRHDLMVPWAHGEWLAGHLPGVEARLDPNEGHLTLLVNRIADAHEWLLDHVSER